MTLDQACVLAKEIVIGSRWRCVIFATGGDQTYIEVETLQMSADLNIEINQLIESRSLTVRAALGGKIRIS